MEEKDLTPTPDDATPDDDSSTDLDDAQPPEPDEDHVVVETDG